MRAMLLQQIGGGIMIIRIEETTEDNSHMVDLDISITILQEQEETRLHTRDLTIIVITVK